MTIDHGKLNTAIRGLYEAAVAPDFWQQAMEQVTDVLNAKSCHFFSNSDTDARDALFAAVRMDPDFHKEYIGTYAELDIRFPRILSAPVGKVLHGDMLWTEEERLASPVYHENLLPFELYEVTGAQLAMPGRLSWLGFSLFDEEPWTQEQLAAQQHILGHTRQALRINLELTRAQARTGMLGDILSRRGTGILLLSADGKVGFANEEAEALQKQHVFRMSRQGLVFREAALNMRLAAALSAVNSRSDAGPPLLMEAVAMSETTDHQIGIRFLPVPGGLDGGGTALAVMCVPMDSEPGPGASEIRQFAGLFGLTLSEELAVGAISSGQDLADHARDRRVSLDTARKHLKHAMAKANCRSQKDLLRLVERFCFFRLR